MLKIQNILVAAVMAATLITPIFASAAGDTTNLADSNGSKILKTDKTQDTKKGGTGGSSSSNSNNSNNNNVPSGGSTWKVEYGTPELVREYYGDTYVARTEFNFFDWKIWETNFNYTNKKIKLVDTKTKSDTYMFNAPFYSYYTAQATEHRTKHLKRKKYKVYKRTDLLFGNLGSLHETRYFEKSTTEDAGTEKYTMPPKIWNMYLKKGIHPINKKIKVVVEEIDVQHRLVK